MKEEEEKKKKKAHKGTSLRWNSTVAGFYFYFRVLAQTRPSTPGNLKAVGAAASLRMTCEQRTPPDPLPDLLLIDKRSIKGEFVTGTKWKSCFN